MGPVRAALQSAVRTTAAEPGPKAIRAHAISPAPIRTRAASGIDRFDDLLATAAAPEHPLLDIDAVGAPARVAGQRPRAASPAAASPSMAAGT
jgi:enoyl-[acyl-carrier protein] reductase I